MDIEELEKLKYIKKKICEKYDMCMEGCPFFSFKDCTDYENEVLQDHIIKMNERYLHEPLEIKIRKIEISEDEISSIFK